MAFLDSFKGKKSKIYYSIDVQVVLKPISAE